VVGQASSLSIRNDGQDARHHQILILFAIIFENPSKHFPTGTIRGVLFSAHALRP
jgi:hypothetical protein